MNAKQQDHGRLVTVLKIADQVLQCLVTLPHQRKVLIHSAVLPFQCSGKPDLLRQIGPGDRIPAMILHGDIKDKEPLSILFLLHHLNQFFVVALVRYIIAHIVSIGKIF